MKKQEEHWKSVEDLRVKHLREVEERKLEGVKREEMAKWELSNERYQNPLFVKYEKQFEEKFVLPDLEHWKQTLKK